MSKVECAIAKRKMATSVQLPGDFACSIQQIGLLQCSCSKRSHWNLILFSLLAVNTLKIKGISVEKHWNIQTGNKLCFYCKGIENQFCVWFTAIHN